MSAPVGGQLSLAGRTAVITGGGQGIGAATARALAAAGAAVVVAARSRDKVDAVAAELKAAGHQAFGLTVDVTDAASVQQLAKAALEKLQRVDILVNNAGVAFSSPLYKQSLDDWNRIMAVNATGTFLCTQAMLPGMVAQEWGRVINIASVAGVSGAKYISAYTAAKHAVVGFTRSVAAEVAAAGVTVNAVCPGYVDTDMTKDSLDRIVRVTRMTQERALDAILERSPQHRLIQPQEVAHMVLSLCDEGAKGITGQAIIIDGGGSLA